MNFFDIGALEILLILVVALIIWGPEKIPEIARTLGKTVRALRKATFDLTTAVTRELETEEKDQPPQKRAKVSRKAKEPPDSGTSESDNTEKTNPSNQ